MQITKLRSRLTCRQPSWDLGLSGCLLTLSTLRSSHHTNAFCTSTPSRLVTTFSSRSLETKVLPSLRRRNNRNDDNKTKVRYAIRDAKGRKFEFLAVTCFRALLQDSWWNEMGKDLYWTRLEKCVQRVTVHNRQYFRSTVVVGTYDRLEQPCTPPTSKYYCSQIQYYVQQSNHTVAGMSYTHRNITKYYTVQYNCTVANSTFWFNQKGIVHNVNIMHMKKPCDSLLIVMAYQ